MLRVEDIKPNGRFTDYMKTYLLSKSAETVEVEEQDAKG